MRVLATTTTHSQKVIQIDSEPHPLSPEKFLSDSLEGNSPKYAVESRAADVVDHDSNTSNADASYSDSL